MQAVADAVGREGVEGLGAVAGLEQEGPPSATWAEGGGEVAGLAGEHQRRQRGELLEARLERRPRRATPAAARPARSRHDEGAQVSLMRQSLAARGARGAKRLPDWPETSIGRPRRAGRPIGQEAGRAGGATASVAGTVGVSLRLRPSCTGPGAVRHPYLTRISRASGFSQAASLRARASSRTAVTARFTSRRAASAVTPSVSPTSR